MRTFGKASQWVLLALVLIALVLVLGVLAWRGCSRKEDPGRKPTAQSQPQPEHGPEQPPAGATSAQLKGPLGKGGQGADDSQTESQDSASSGASGSARGDSRRGSSGAGSGGAQPSAESPGQSPGDSPHSGALGQGRGPGIKGDPPRPEGNAPPGSGAGGQSPRGDPLSDAGLSPEQVAQAVAAARDAAVQARQSAQRGNHRQAYRSALAGWERIWGLARFDNEAAAAAEELFCLLQQYGKTLESGTEPPAPTMDQTPLITR